MMEIQLILTMDVIILETLRISGTEEIMYYRKVYDSRCVEMGLMIMLMNSEMMVIMSQGTDAIINESLKMAMSE